MPLWPLSCRIPPFVFVSAASSHFVVAKGTHTPFALLFLTFLPLLFFVLHFRPPQLQRLQDSALKSARDVMDVYFSRIRRLAESDKLESRLRFMLLDVIEQRARGWETRRKKEGPKKIEVGVDSDNAKLCVGGGLFGGELCVQGGGGADAAQGGAQEDRGVC
jgi:hypothetical protein